MSLIIDIADAVVASLNAGKFSQAFTAARAYLPQFDLKDMDALHVTVVPKAIDIAPLDRSRVQNDVQIDVAVQQRLPVDDQDEAMDELMALVQEIAAHFRVRRVADAVWLATENNLIYLPDHLNNLRQFTSVLTFTFRAAA